MNSPSKIIFIVMVTVFALFQGSMSHGREKETNLTGKWAGNAFLCATTNGFGSSEDVIKINIYQQEDLKFKGTIERSYHGNTLLQNIQGYFRQK